MRPRKKIALYSSHEETADILRFALETRGQYSVFSTGDEQVYIDWVEQFDIRACLVDLSHKVPESVMELDKQFREPRVPFVMYGLLYSSQGFDYPVLGGPDLMQRLLIAMAMACARKRGPKPTLKKKMDAPVYLCEHIA